MSAETDVKSTLGAAAAVTALVSDRITPDARAQDAATPAIVYQRTGTQFVPTIHSAVALTRVTLAVIAIADTRASAEAVADAAQAALLTAGMDPVARVAEFDEAADKHIVTLQIEHVS